MINIIKKTLKEVCKKLLSKKNVVAVGIGFKQIAGKKTDILSIVCSVTKKVPLPELSKKDKVPEKIKGIRTDIVETGVIKALKSRTDRWRPAPGGVSIGHEKITAGTLGCLVKRDGFIQILSNNHVLANSNNASIGDAILQPGKYDGGRLMDRIATLSGFVPIEFSGVPDGCGISKMIVFCLNLLAKITASKSRLQSINIEQKENLVDAAIAEPLDINNVVKEIMGLGYINGLNILPKLGMKIQKSGRTTALTQGEILQLNVTVQVQYGEGKIALFTDQMLAGDMCDGGDSGSVVLDENNHLMGLLFAGSDTSTIINRISHVFKELKLTL